MNSTALVLLSGGLDSATLLAHALDADVEIRGAVFADYGQQQLREASAAREVAEHYGVDLVELDLRSFVAAVSSAGDGDTAAAPSPVVWNRDTVLLAAAAGIARAKGSRAVLTAARAGEWPVAPGGRGRGFIDAMSIATSLGCGVRIDAPFGSWTKAEVAARSHHLQVPVHYTWSCSADGDVHCGRCTGCFARAAAFQTARVPDPTPYANPEAFSAAVVDA